ncbi:hypothetical protein [Paraburkholderia flava]|uniref:hypothetical protein n=1 Tax=Paraburkholderia flava TaxID=2547393 RepID=UPI0010603AFE|nr:hypothetical protein [Paraburkholderia flava]
MSAPDNSNSKAPPSLLSDTEKGAQANGSRILANLEGRVAPPTDKPRRSRAPIAIVALLVIAAGGWGAWQLQHRAGHSEVVASSASTATPAPTAASKAVATPASGTAQVAAKAPDSAASASQAATIIADDSTDKDTKASTDAAASGAGDDSRLSRALASGAQDASDTAPAASAAATTATTAVVKHDKSTTVASNATKHDASHTKHEAANAHHAGASTTVAQAKKSTHDAKAGATRDDSDADLLAALVARTKPADAKPAPTKNNGATGKSAPHASRAGTPAPATASLAQRVKECSEQGFFEEQFCRWRVCDGHWGKDAACPSASQTRQP